MRYFLVLFLALCSAQVNAAVGTLGTPQRGAGVATVNYNIVTDGGAVCNGDIQTVTRNITVSTSTNPTNFSTPAADTFVVGDVGKVIYVNNSTYMGVIVAWVDARNVTMSKNSPLNLTNFSASVTYGHDAQDAFRTFNTWALANQGSSQVVLTAPPGSNCWLGQPQINGQTNSFAAGIRNFLFEGNGSTLNTLQGGGGFGFGGIGVCNQGLADTNGCSAKIKTVSAGATQVELTAASYASGNTCPGVGYICRFAVGNWVMLGGLDSQGLWLGNGGYPPNQGYFEWRQITAICINTGPCTGTATITLNSPLTNSYLSTWPGFATGSAFESDPGGNATIWKVGGSTDNWSVTQKVRNLTISQSFPTYSKAKNFTYENVTFIGTNCANPSENESITWINVTMNSCFVEVDKLIGTYTVSNSSIFQQHFQSNSVGSFIASNTSFTNLVGLANSSQLTDVTIGTLFNLGSDTNGNTSGSTVFTRVGVTTFSGVSGGVGDYQNSPWPYVMSGGVISYPVAATTGSGPPNRWASRIGLTMPFSNTTYGSIGVFKVTGVSGGVWPAADDQTVTTNVTIGAGAYNSTTLHVSTPGTFSSGDVRKSILVGGAGGSSPQCPPTNICRHKAWITGFTDDQTVTLSFPVVTNVNNTSQTIQFGTANVDIATNQAGGFPPTGSIGGGTVTFTTGGGVISPLGAPSFTCDACTGDAKLVAMNVQRGATPGDPWATSSSITYTPTSGQGQLQQMIGIGKLVSLTVDVTQEYTGASTPVRVTPVGPFGGTLIKQGTWTTFSWNPVINLKVRGKRVITPTGVTCDTGGGPVSGGCSGDTINSTDGYPTDPNTWVRAAITPTMGDGYSGGTPATFTITLKTDQTP